MSASVPPPDRHGRSASSRGGGHWRIAVSALVVLALVGLLAFTLFLPGSSGRSPPATAPARSPASSAPTPRQPSTATVPGRSGQLTVVETIPGQLAVHASPNGHVVGTLSSHTQFGSPRVVPVVRAVSGWLGVVTSKVDNGKLGWIPARGAQLEQIGYSIRIETRSHRVTVFDNGHIVRTMTAGVGTSNTPTPVGQFAVTDKLHFNPPSSAYGCCALALSAHQLKLLPGWTGGDLVAIHSTPDTASIGRSVSHGCVRVSLVQGRWLMNNIPLGTLVTIRDR